MDCGRIATHCTGVWYGVMAQAAASEIKRNAIGGQTNMFSIKDMKYKTKLALMAGTAMVGILVLTAISFTTMNKVEIGGKLYERLHNDYSLASDTSPAALSIGETRRILLEAEDAADVNKSAGFLEKAKAAEKAQYDGLAEYKSKIKDPKVLAELDGDVATKAKQYYSIMESEYLPLIQAGKFQEARELRHAKMRQLGNEQMEAIDALNNGVNDLIKQRELEAKSAVNSAGWIIGLLGLAVLVVTGTLSFLIARHINEQIGKIHAASEALASGDLTHRIATKSADEMGDVGRALNKAFEKLSDVIGEITGHSETIASASEELSSSATQIASSTESQRSQAVQVATAMQEMSSTVLQVSDNSNQASDSARHAGELAKNGGKVVSETVKVIQEVSTSTRDTATKIEELGRSSDEIGKIINTIDDIADQTNLLALNAAIEAARAGEQGRGFAVVADEVRKLAERTTSATKEIASMIQTIQDETKKSVEAMRQGTIKVDAGVDAANKAGQALSQIIENADALQDMITHIATAATEQSAATEEVNNNMEQISKMVQQSAVGAEESAKACQSLSDLALDLQQVVSTFKIDASARRNRRKVNRESSLGYTPMPSDDSGGDIFHSIQ